MSDRIRAQNNVIAKIREVMGIEPVGKLASNAGTFLDYPGFMIEFNDTEVNLLLNLKHELFSGATNLASLVTDITSSEASQAGYNGCQVHDISETQGGQ